MTGFQKGGCPFEADSRRLGHDDREQVEAHLARLLAVTQRAADSGCLKRRALQFSYRALGSGDLVGGSRLHLDADQRVALERDYVDFAMA